MLSKPDADGMRPLSGKEYAALKCVIVAFNELDKCAEYLHERCSLIPGGWRDMKLVLSKIDRLRIDIGETIPYAKRASINADIQHSQIVLHTIGADRSQTPDVVWIDEKAFVALMEYVVNLECWSCEKTGKDVKRCQIKRLLLDVLHYDSDPKEFPEDGRCELSGCTTARKEREHNETEQII